MSKKSTESSKIMSSGHNMIDYTLAKKLKDAGFLQDTLWSFGVHYDPLSGKVAVTPQLILTNNHIIDFDSYVASPTLSELIKACREERDYVPGSFSLEDGSYHTDVEYIEQWGAEAQYAGNRKIYTQHEEFPDVAVAKVLLEKLLLKQSLKLNKK